MNSLRGFYQARAFALLSPDQFRPVAPPVFGSATFNSALAEIRAFSDGLTPAQLKIAQDWAARGGAYMNGVAAEMLMFPEETTTLNAMVQEAELSRMYGGLHYRFDLEAGQELGRKVAGYVLQVLGASRAAITLY